MKVDIFEDKYLSQDLSILHNTVKGSGVEVSGGREGGVIPLRDSLAHPVETSVVIVLTVPLNAMRPFPPI